MSDDFSAKITQLLNSEEGMQQIKNIAASLGLPGFGGSANTPQNGGLTNQSGPNSIPINNNNSVQNGFGNFGGQNGFNNQAMPNNSGNGFAQPPQGQPAPDLSSLMSMLSGMMGNNQAPQHNSSPLPNIDMNMMLKIQQAPAILQTSDKNVDLLNALKPHFSSERAKKVDDAIKIMQLIRLLPMIKDSGLF
ncbi:MAG TPA: hypothetical protein DCP97_04675 [Ruminococcaceae bacterium]|nr:hypothetical protein [Oscillospiraceae bacterium]